MIDSIRRAFKDARYMIQLPGQDIVLRIDRHSTALGALMRTHHARSVAILTAWNPGGKPADAAVNIAAQTALEAELCTTGATLLAGRNMAAEGDPCGHLYTEPTVVVFGMTRARAHAIAHTYGQLAFVYVGPDGIAELVWVHEPDNQTAP